jgi:hypothetical protein
VHHISLLLSILYHGREEAHLRAFRECHISCWPHPTQHASDTKVVVWKQGWGSGSIVNPALSIRANTIITTLILNSHIRDHMLYEDLVPFLALLRIAAGACLHIHLITSSKVSKV